MDKNRKYLLAVYNLYNRCNFFFQYAVTCLTICCKCVIKYESFFNMVLSSALIFIYVNVEYGQFIGGLPSQFEVFFKKF